MNRNYLENLPLAEYRKCFYQHDGAPAHNAHLVKNFLLETFADRWIGNNGPFLWPPRSPDLAVLDFFVWGAIKDQVNSTPLTTKENCMDRVRNAFQNLNPLSIRKATHEELLRRCEKCLAVEGRNFEHLL